VARFGLDTHPKFLRLSRRLNAIATGMGEQLAWGLLETMWSAAYDRLDDMIGDAEDVEATCRWRGQPGELAMWLADCGFIEEREPGIYYVHDLWDHAPEAVKKRLKGELQRRASGKTISDLRSESGRQGRQKQLEKQGDGAANPISDHDTNVALRANVGQTAAICRQTADKPQPFAGKSLPGKGREGKGEKEIAASAAPAPLLEPDPPPKPELPLGPTREQAERAIADASSGRYVVAQRTKGGTLALDRARRQHPEIGAFVRVGRWLGAGGDAWKGTVDSRNLGNDLAAWLAHAAEWDGSSPVQQRPNGRASPADNRPRPPVVARYEPPRVDHLVPSSQLARKPEPA
jgi:hypothetical protein